MDDKQLELDFRDNKTFFDGFSDWNKKRNFRIKVDSIPDLSASLTTEFKELAERIYRELGVPSWMINN